MSKNKNIKVKLFIEGELIPFNNININSSVGQPSTLTVNMVPSPFIKRLVPRSHILVLFQEFADEDISKGWSVLWDGEYRGWGSNRSSQGASMSVTAVDYSNALASMTSVLTNGNGMNHQSAIHAVFHTGASFDITPPGGGTFTKQITDYLEKEGDNVTFSGLITKILEELFLKNPHFATSKTSTKFIERFHSLEDKEIDEIFTNSIAGDYFKSLIANKFHGNVSFDAVLNYFLETADYIRVPMSTPSFMNGPTHTLFKPRCIFSTPPCCNCFFPSMYSTISGFGVDYFMEPTRVLLHTPVSPVNGGEASDILFFYNNSDAALKTESNITSADTVQGLLSREELDNSVIPMVINLTYEKTLNIRTHSDQDTDAVKNNMLHQAMKEFIEAKYARRQVSVNMEFHPYCVVGFPGIVFDRQQSLLGNVHSVMHTLSADGNASTVVTLSHAHAADETEAAARNTAPISNWTSDKYRPENCEKTYGELFGTNNLADGATASMGGSDIKGFELPAVFDMSNKGTRYNIGEIADTVFPIGPPVGRSLHENAADKPGFAENYSCRELVTADEYFKYMNIEGSVNDKSLQSSTLYEHADKAEFSEYGQPYSTTGTHHRKKQAAIDLGRDVEDEAKLGF